MDEKRQADYEPLTDRELEILGLIADGLTNQQIADQLFLTLDTVKWYNKQSYQKLGVRNRTQAVARGRELGLLDEEVLAAKHNLPAERTVFIGREQELADIQARLADPACRLLTLVGPGGIGKTRLAIEAARRQMASYVDGVFFIPFASVESPEFVVPTLADGLGLTQSNQRDPLTQISNFLRDKTLLLLIDNFEHLFGEVNLLGELLDQSKAAKLLVTSRERLHLKAEWVFDVQGLHYPPIREAEQGSSDLIEYEAVQLFLRTARRVQLAFIPNENDLLHIARICQLVGGMPLGIELAASWVRLLSCAEIAREIEHNLDILTTSWRDLPERHRSIQAVLDHSWQLLTPEEQEVFQRLTVFSGSFVRESGTAVAGATLPTLLALVDKSFVQKDDGDRFSIHELVKQYGTDKLRADTAVWMETRQRHCHFHANFLSDRMNTQDPSSSLEEIERVFDDIQAAWHFAVGHRQLAEIQRMAAGFRTYYRYHSWYRAGSGALNLYQRALGCFDSATENPEHQTTVSYLYESIAALQGLATSHEDAITAYEQALSNTAEDDHVGRGRLYGKLADVWVALHRHEQGDKFYEQAESELDKVFQRDPVWWDEWFRIQTQRMELYYWQNRPDSMASLATQLSPLIDEHGSVTQKMRYLYLLGMWAVRRDNYFYSSDAITYTGDALALSLKTGNLEEIAYRYFSHGFCHLWSDQLDEAETYLQIARQMTEQNGDLALLARTLAYLTVVYRKRGDKESVRDFADYSLRIAEEANMPQYTGMARTQYAWLAWCAGDLAEVKQQVRDAIAVWGGLSTIRESIPFYWFALFPLMGVALQEEDFEQAVHCAQHMLTPFQQRLPDDLTTLLENGIAAWHKEQFHKAKDLLHQAFQKAHMTGYV